MTENMKNFMHTMKNIQSTFFLSFLHNETRCRAFFRRLHDFRKRSRINQYKVREQKLTRKTDTASATQTHTRDLTIASISFLKTIAFAQYANAKEI